MLILLLIRTGEFMAGYFSAEATKVKCWELPTIFLLILVPRHDAGGSWQEQQPPKAVSRAILILLSSKRVELLMHFSTGQLFQ